MWGKGSRLTPGCCLLCAHFCLFQNTRTGGKGSVRRKKKTVHKNVTTDDKRLQSTLKRLGVNNIPAIEEVE